MHRISRESGETIDIGRGNHYETETYSSRNLQRPYPAGFDDEYRPRREYWEDEAYERPMRPMRYAPPAYYDYDEAPREHLTPAARGYFASASHPAPLSYMRPRTQSQMVGAGSKPRSPWPVDDYGNEDAYAVRRIKTVFSHTDHPDKKNLASKVRHDLKHHPGIFQTIFDVNHPQDSSIHLELHITDDHDNALEVFSRLQRLGNFSAAFEYFQGNLEPFLGNPYVFVQFGQMLLDQGDYLAFEQLNPDAAFGKEHRTVSRSCEDVVTRDRFRSRSREREWQRETRTRARSLSPIRGRSTYLVKGYIPRPNSMDSLRSYYDGFGAAERVDNGLFPDVQLETEYDEVELLHQNWRLLNATFGMQRKGDFEDAVTEAWYTIKCFRFGAGIGSTEIQLIRLVLQLCAEVRNVEPQRYYDTGLEGFAREWINWPALFKQLFVQGRIWDFKDVYAAAAAAFPDAADELFLGAGDTKRSLIDDWDLDGEDESTNLAQLNLLLASAPDQPSVLGQATSRAEALIVHSPAATKSRPFILWILAKAANVLFGDKGRDDDPWLAHEAHLKNFPGMVWYCQGSPLPNFYVPRNHENPGWVGPQLSMDMTEPCLLALNLAKELDDYRCQVACYKLLISQSQDPTELLQELSCLQKFKQGDKRGHLETLLLSYLVCKDRSAKEKLLVELEQTNDWGDDTRLCDGPKYWARDFIERALKRSLEGPTSIARLRHPASYYMDKGLPPEAQEFTWQNADPDGAPRTNHYSLGSDDRLHVNPLPRRPSTMHKQQMVKPFHDPELYHSATRRLQWSEPLPPPPTSRLDSHGLDRRRNTETSQVDDSRQFERREDNFREPSVGIVQKDSRERMRLDRMEDGLVRERAELREAQDREERKRQIRRWEEDSRQERDMLESNARMRESSRPKKPDEDFGHIPASRVAHREGVRFSMEEEPMERKRTKTITRKEEEELHAKEMERMLLMKEQDSEATAKRAKEKQQQESRDQRDRDFRDRLARAEVALQEQAERLRRAEDRQYQERLERRGSRHQGKARGKSTRTARKDSYVLDSKASHTYSDTFSSAGDDSFRDDGSYKDETHPGKSTRGSGEGEPEQEKESDRRRRGKQSSEVTGNEIDHNDNISTRGTQQDYCTDIVLYSGAQPLESSGRSVTESPVRQTPTLPISSPNGAHVESSGMSAEQSTQNSKTMSKSTAESGGKRELQTEGTQDYFQERAAYLTAEPEETADQLQSKGNADSSRNINPPMVQKIGSRQHGQPQSKEQNEKIANRPPRVVTDSPVPKRKATYWDGIIAKEQEKLEKLARFAEEDISREMLPRRVGVESRPVSTHAVLSRSRSAPSSRQEPDDIQAIERRKSWHDRNIANSSVDRLEAPSRRPTLIFDADGRPQPVRTTSGHNRNYVGDVSGGPYMRVQHGDKNEKGRSLPSKSPNAAGKRPQRPVGSRSQSTGDMGVRHQPAGPNLSSPERFPVDHWEREKDGSWTKSKAMSALREDPEEGGQPTPSHIQPGPKSGASSQFRASVEPEPGISRKPTVADDESDED